MELIAPTKNLQRYSVQQIEELFPELHGWGRAIDLNESGVPGDPIALWEIKNGILQPESIGLSVGPVQPGRGYTGPATIAITGLLTTDVITADSTAIPTCTVNGTLTLAASVYYGVSITRAGELIAYYPFAEGAGTVCINSIINAPFALQNGVISDADIHTEILDGGGYDLNQDGFSNTENLSIYSNPETGTWIFGSNANPIDTGDGWQVDVVDTWVVRQGARTNSDLFVPGDIVNFSYSLKAPAGQAGTVKLRDATGLFTPSTITVAITDQYARYTVQRTKLDGGTTYADPGIYLGGTLSKVIFKDIQTHVVSNALFVNTVGTAIPSGLKPTLVGGRSSISGTIVALGDSITGSDWPLVIDDMLPNNPTIIDSGVAGNTVRQAIDRLDTDYFNYNPSLGVVLIGINNILGGDTLSGLKVDYEELVSAITSNTPSVLLLSLTPCKGSIAWSIEKQTMIDSFNEWLPGIAIAYGCSYKDIYTSMEDPDVPDTLLPTYQVGDWLHHSPKGVLALTQVIESGFPGTRIAVDSISNLPLQYPGPLKLNFTIVSGTGPSDWIVKFSDSPLIRQILGINNIYFDITGVSLAVAYGDLGDNVYLFDGTKGVAFYSTDMSADEAKIRRVIGTDV